MRTILFGVDGLSFRVLHPLMQRGELPNFQKLRDAGSEAILESRYPPRTPAARTSISTGMKPAAHGVYDFWEYDEQQEPGTPRRAHIQTHRKGSKAISITPFFAHFGGPSFLVCLPGVRFCACVRKKICS